MKILNFDIKSYKITTAIKKKFVSSLLSFECPICKKPMELSLFLGSFNERLCFISTCPQDEKNYFTIAELVRGKSPDLLTEKSSDL